MKRIVFFLLIAILGAAAAFAIPGSRGARSAEQDFEQFRGQSRPQSNRPAADELRGPGADGGYHEQMLEGMPIESLSREDGEGLVQIAEEEKLARDIYTALYERWGVRSFANIARSEQTHMDSVATLLERYEIDLPASYDRAGEYSAAEFGELYSDFVSSGDASLEDALAVGASVEDMDIADIEAYLQEVENEDISAVLGNLVRGSENHLGAFVGQLERRGESYEPQYISEERCDSAIADAEMGGRRVSDRGGVVTRAGVSRRGGAQGRAAGPAGRR